MVKKRVERVVTTKPESDADNGMVRTETRTTRSETPSEYEVRTVKKSNSGIWITAVVLLVIAVLAVLGWFWFGKPDSTTIIKDTERAAGAVYDSAKDAVTPSTPASKPN